VDAMPEEVLIESDWTNAMRVDIFK
jgi:hypothetical protein